MSRYALVILLALCSIALGSRYLSSPPVPTLQLLQGPPDAATLGILTAEGATFEVDAGGLFVKADKAGIRCLYLLRTSYCAQRDACLDNLDKIRKTGRCEDGYFEEQAKHIRLLDSYAGTYDRALRRLEEENPHLLVGRAPMLTMVKSVDIGAQMVGESETDNVLEVR